MYDRVVDLVALDVILALEASGKQCTWIEKLHDCRSLRSNPCQFCLCHDFDDDDAIVTIVVIAM